VSAPDWWPDFVAELVAEAGAMSPYNVRLLDATAELEDEVLTVTLPSRPLRLYLEQRLPKYWQGAVQWS